LRLYEATSLLPVERGWGSVGEEKGENMSTVETHGTDGATASKEVAQSLLGYMGREVRDEDIRSLRIK